MDLDLYHERITALVDKSMSEHDRPTYHLKWVIGWAHEGKIIPNFVFQDEDARHFNHDIVKECQRRLGA
jgi:hypothetical protein